MALSLDRAKVSRSKAAASWVCQAGELITSDCTYLVSVSEDASARDTDRLHLGVVDADGPWATTKMWQIGALIRADGIAIDFDKVVRLQSPVTFRGNTTVAVRVSTSKKTVSIVVGGSVSSELSFTWPKVRLAVLINRIGSSAHLLDCLPGVTHTSVPAIEQAITAASFEEGRDDAVACAAAARAEQDGIFFNFILAEKLLESDYLRGKTKKPLPKLQDIERNHPNWIVRLPVDMAGSVRGEFSESFVAISHRWETSEEPDPTGEQSGHVDNYLRSNKSVAYVWMDCANSVIELYTRSTVLL